MAVAPPCAASLSPISSHCTSWPHSRTRSSSAQLSNSLVSTAMTMASFSHIKKKLTFRIAIDLHGWKTKKYKELFSKNSPFSLPYLTIPCLLSAQPVISFLEIIPVYELKRKHEYRFLFSLYFTQIACCAHALISCFSSLNDMSGKRPFPQYGEHILLLASWSSTLWMCHSVFNQCPMVVIWVVPIFAITNKAYNH